jgi:hypothetical protein
MVQKYSSLLKEVAVALREKEAKKIKEVFLLVWETHPNI